MVYGITYLRALAALAVALFHVLSYIKIHHGVVYINNYNFLASGVDLFFVISGFIMVHSTRKFSATRIDSFDFIIRRLIRVAPLYWIITALVFILFLFNSSISQKPLDLATLIRSFLFIPTWFEGENLVCTIISPGWTLCYEMFFYAGFAIFVGWNYRRGVLLLAALFIGLSSLHLFVPDSYYAKFYSNPLMMEFLFGMLIAYAPKAKMPILAILCGFIWIVTVKQLIEVRFIYWGIGAALVVWGAISFEIKSPLKYLVLLGDASYSIYLTHMYVIRGAIKLSSDSVYAVPFCILCIIVFGVLVHKTLEVRLGSILMSARNSYCSNKSMFTMVKKAQSPIK